MRRRRAQEAQIRLHFVRFVRAMPLLGCVIVVTRVEQYEIKMAAVALGLILVYLMRA